MNIANPIYDVVFKYLLDDNKIAKKLLSLIIGKEIEELELKPTEFRNDLKEKTLTVYRLDFAAKVRLEDGSETNVIIEIQKAKFPTDIMRFRKYLGGQYVSEDNSYIKDDRKKARPILSIYFLGHSLKNVSVPVIKVERKYYDNTTGQELTQKEEFIESLTHDSFVIQIPALREQRRNKLEKVLSIFDQGSNKGVKHFLNFNDEDYPDEYKEVIRRLLKAAAEPKVRQTMDIEDDILAELEDLERLVAKKDKTIQENTKTIEDNKKTLEDKNKTIEDKNKTIENKDKELEALKKQIEKLKTN
ncbi:MAG: hypothetical protein U9O87_09125 [Verrucomicrobiota bacterium]|nr:hypothetical protein [Verrucomicrobiota bacterium]